MTKSIIFKRILQIMWLLIMAFSLALDPVLIDCFENYIFNFPLNWFVFFCLGFLFLNFSLRE